MPDQQQDTLSGQQVQALQKHFQTEVQRLVAKLELREKALEAACKVATTIGADDVVKLAGAMFDFLTADLPKPDPASANRP